MSLAGTDPRPDENETTRSARPARPSWTQGGPWTKCPSPPQRSPALAGAAVHGGGHALGVWSTSTIACETTLSIYARSSHQMCAGA